MAKKVGVTQSGKKSTGYNAVETEERGKAWMLLIKIPEFLEDLRSVKLQYAKTKKPSAKKDEIFPREKNFPLLRWFQHTWGFSPIDCFTPLDDDRLENFQSDDFRIGFGNYKPRVGASFSQAIDWGSPDHVQEMAEEPLFDEETMEVIMPVKRGSKILREKDLWYEKKQYRDEETPIDFSCYKIHVDLTLPKELLENEFSKAITKIRKHFNLQPGKKRTFHRHDEFLVGCLIRKNIHLNREKKKELTMSKIVDRLSSDALLKMKYNSKERIQHRERIENLARNEAKNLNYKLRSKLSE